MGVKEIIRPFKPQNWLYSSLFSIEFSCSSNSGDWTVKSESNKSSVVDSLKQLKVCLPASNLQVEEKYVESVKIGMGKVKVVDQRVRNCGRGRGRRRGQGIRRVNSSDKDEKQGKDNGSNRNGQNGERRRGGGTGSGGNGDDRRRKDDDEGDDDEDDDNEENDEESNDGENEDDEKDEEDPALSGESGNGDSLQELLQLFPPKRLDCNPPELPAAPGTPVALHGVVLHETTGGLVVLNVRWRNKLYSGALIDVKRNRWSSSRIPPDPLASTSVSARGHNGCHKLKGKSKKKEPESQSQQPQFKEPSLVAKPVKRPLTATTNTENADIASGKKARFSPPLIVCPEPNCGKKYKHMNGLKYHQAHAHLGKGEDGKEKSPDELEDTNIDSPSKDHKSSTIDSSEGEILHLSKIKVEEDVRYLDQNSNKASVDEPNAEDEVINVVETSIPDGQDFIKQARLAADKLRENISTPEKSTPEIHIDPCATPTSPDLNKDDNISLPKNESKGTIPEPYSLSSLSVGGFSGYAQYSPTLASLNPQTLNNSLSNALQSASTAVTSDVELTQSTAVQNSLKGNFEGGSGVKPDQIVNNDTTNLVDKPGASGVASDKGVKEGQTLDVKEEIVPSSPSNEDDFTELLPGTLELLLKGKSPARMSPLIVTSVKTEKSNEEIKTYNEGQFYRSAVSDGTQCAPNQKEGSSSSVQEREQSSYLDRADNSRFQILYQQAQDGRYFPMPFPGSWSMTGDLAAPSEIQKAVSQVDIRRHFSPMLLSYLNSGSKSEPDQPRGNDLDIGSSTIAKGAKSAIDMKGKHDSSLDKKPSLEGKEKQLEAAKIPQSAASTETTNIGFSAADTKSPERPMLHPGPILVPNITAGRPISRPISKPGSITGGSITSGSITGGQILPSNSQQSPQSYKASLSSQGRTTPEGATSKKLNTTKSAATTSKVATSASKASVSSKATQGSSGELSTEQTEKQIAAVTTGGQNEGLSYMPPTSITDRSMIEAKTWIPKEVYWQLGKSNGNTGGPVSETEVKLAVSTTGAAVSYPPLFSASTKPILARPDIGMTVPDSVPLRNIGPMQQQNRSIPSPAQYPVPIAPAPSKQSEKTEAGDQVTVEHSVSDGPHIGRFTLNRDKKLVPSPAESRGRPRKVRVERTQQIPVGNAKGTAGTASPSEQRMRKQSDVSETSVRPSVIHSMQGDPKSAMHGMEEKDSIQVGIKRSSPVESPQDKRLRSVESMKEEAKRSMEQDKSKIRMAEMFHFKDGSLSKSPGTPGLRDTKQPFGLSASSEKMKEKGPSTEPSRDIRLGPVSSSDLQMQLQRFETSCLRLPLSFSSMHSSIPGMYPGLPIPHGYFGAPPGLSPEDQRGISSISSRAGGQPPDLNTSKKQDDSREDKNISKAKHISEHFSSSLSQTRSRPPSTEGLSPQMGSFHQKSLWTPQSDASTAVRQSPDSSKHYFRQSEQASPGIYPDRSHRLTPQNRSGFESFKDESRRDFNSPPYPAPYFQQAFGSPRFPERTLPGSTTEKEMSQRRFMDSRDGKSSIGGERYPTPGGERYPTPGGERYPAPTPPYMQTRSPSVSHETVFGRGVQTPGLRSSNLILTKADGAIVGPLPFGSKPPGSKR